MTTVVVILIGIGGTLIASAIDCTPIASTFMKIIQGGTIDWTGTQNCQGTIPQAPTSGSSATIGSGTQGRLRNPNPDGTCPQGYTLVVVSNGKHMCERNQ